MDVSDGAIDESHGQPLLEVVGALLAKTAYGHWVGRALALSLALEQAQDRFLVNVLTQDPWSREMLAADVVHRLPSDRKVVMVRQALSHLGVDSSLVSKTAHRIKEVLDLRNIIAHSSLSDSSISATGDFVFDGYRRGKARTHSKSPGQIDEVIDGGTSALALLTQQERVLRPETEN